MAMLDIEEQYRLLRTWGYPVTLHPGAATRGVGGAMGQTAIGGIFHHTASSPRSSKNASWGIITKGRTGASPLRPPVCQTYMDRDNHIHLWAGGICNHAGKVAAEAVRMVKSDTRFTHDARAKGWRDAMGGNSLFWGLEVEHAGTSAEPWSAQKTEYACAVMVAGAIANGRGRNTTIGHRQATPRKIDPVVATAIWHGVYDDLWDAHSGVTSHKPATPPVTPAAAFKPYSATEWARFGLLRLGSKGEAVQRLQVLLNLDGAHLVCDGSFGQQTALAVAERQRRKTPNLNPASAGVVGLHTAIALGLVA